MKRLLRPSCVATLLVLLAGLAAAAVVLATGARVDALGPVIVFSVAVALVVALLLPEHLGRR